MICLKCGKYIDGDGELERELGLCQCDEPGINYPPSKQQEHPGDFLPELDFYFDQDD